MKEKKSSIFIVVVDKCFNSRKKFITVAFKFILTKFFKAISKIAFIQCFFALKWTDESVNNFTKI